MDIQKANKAFEKFLQRVCITVGWVLATAFIALSVATPWVAASGMPGGLMQLPASIVSMCLAFDLGVASMLVFGIAFDSNNKLKLVANILATGAVICLGVALILGLIGVL